MIWTIVAIIGISIVQYVVGSVISAREKKQQEAAAEAERKRREEEHNRRLKEEQAERQRRLEKERAARQRREKERAKRLARLRREEEARKKREKEERDRQIEALLRRDAVKEEVNYMSGREFERFMADLFRKKGYSVHATPETGDQGVDLLLTIDERRIAVQLKRWTGPVGNAVIGATFAGMMHYKAREAWVITTNSFTKSAKELAKSTGVRLIDGGELEDWLDGLRDDRHGDP